MYGTRVLKKAVLRLADEENSTFPEGTTSHDCRHHYASVLLSAGESVVAVAERLGHDDAWSAPTEKAATAPGRPP
jgi:integrase